MLDKEGGEASLHGICRWLLEYLLALVDGAPSRESIPDTGFYV